MAFGIDSIAHIAALDAGGTTIAVLGSGIDSASVTPREHEPLARRIDGPKGLVVSEYDPGSAPNKGSYPARNRIISGLSQVTIIVEADIKSGSLITAKHALDQGREVYAVPGSIFWPRSEGTNWLIAQGAHPMLHIEEVIESVLGVGPRAATQGQATPSTDNSLDQRIVALLNEHGPLHMDTIVETLACPAHEAMIALSMLELSARIRSANGIYRTT
jgi:DNA processing protein